MKRRGFTLVELLIYVAIFSILAMIFSTIFLTYYRVDREQTARNEISSQLNFALQTIQQMINEAATAVVRNTIDTGNNWDEEDSVVGTPQNYLVLKSRKESNLAADAESPIVVYAANGLIKIRKGRGSQQTETPLTTGKINIDRLTFRKLVNYPGREVIGIDLTASYQDTASGRQITRRLISGAGKAEAAVFDTSLLPGSGNAIDVGQSAQRWRDGYFSNNLSVGNQINTNSLIIGNETIINGIRTGFLTVDPPSMTANSNSTLQISAAGIDASDRVFLTPPPDLEEGLVFVGARAVASSNAIEITLRNTTAAAINGAPKDWAYLLIK